MRRADVDAAFLALLSQCYKIDQDSGVAPVIRNIKQTRTDFWRCPAVTLPSSEGTPAGKQCAPIRPRCQRGTKLVESAEARNAPPVGVC